MKKALWLGALVILCFSSCFREQCNPGTGNISVQDSVKRSLALQQRNRVLDRIGDAPLEDNGMSQYHFVQYSARGYGKSIKIIERNQHYFMSVHGYRKDELRDSPQATGRKSLQTDGSMSCINFETEIKDTEWMIFGYNSEVSDFWLHKLQDTDHWNVADSNIYIVEVTRPVSKRCAGQSHRMVISNTLDYPAEDAIIAMMFRYAEDLAKQYGTKNEQKARFAQYKRKPTDTKR